VFNLGKPKTAGDWIVHIAGAIVALFLVWWMLRVQDHFDEFAYSVHQSRFHHHGLHHLVLSDQLVSVDGVRVDVQSRADIGMPQHGLNRFDVGFGLRN